MPTPNKRFKIIASGDPHTFMSFETDWDVYDNNTNKRIKSFKGDARDPEDIQSVEFSKDGKEVIAKDEHGQIVERFKLPQ